MGFSSIQTSAHGVALMLTSPIGAEVHLSSPTRLNGHSFARLVSGVAADELELVIADRSRITSAWVVPTSLPFTKTCMGRVRQQTHSRSSARSVVASEQTSCPPEERHRSGLPSRGGAARSATSGTPSGTRCPFGVTALGHHVSKRSRTRERMERLEARVVPEQASTPGAVFVT